MIRFFLQGARSIRGKMLVAALFPLFFTLLLVWGAALYLIDAWIVDETQKKVRQDLSAARTVLLHEEDHIGDVIRFSAGYAALAIALEKSAPGTVEQELRMILRRERLDFLTLADASGQVLVRATPDGSAEGSAPPALVGKDHADGYCGLILLSEEQLRQESAAMASRARVPRREASSGETGVETRGMLLVCSSPVTGEGGKVVGYLYGGVLLNGNLDLVDRIKEIVYGRENYRGTEVGSATLFLGDLRVATTVRLKDGERALGTTISDAVAEAVLGQRRTWLDRAKVVEDWYLTAYEPLLGPDGEAIGAFYVGQLEKPFDDLKARAALALMGLLLVGGTLGALFALQGARRLSRPILDLEEGARRIASGERDLRVEISSRDEIGALGAAFNRMTASLREKEEALQTLNRELEKKVRERTAELEEKSWQLIRAREELARTEKLAAIGALAAGVAHEINNPTAVIRGNAELLLSLLSPDDTRREEATEILKQTERIALITQNMLAFARRRALRPDRVRVDALMGDVLSRIRHQVPLGHVEIRQAIDPDLPSVEGDAEQLRQVFNNLVLNALQALEGEGVLKVAIRREGANVLVEVSDSGAGIAPEVREKIFDPFFSTKKGGTGLGLSVSYGTVQAMGGTIEVESEPGEGALFRVRLPLKPGADPLESPPEGG